MIILKSLLVFHITTRFIVFIIYKVGVRSQGCLKPVYTKNIRQQVPATFSWRREFCAAKHFHSLRSQKCVSRTCFAVRPYFPQVIFAGTNAPSKIPGGGSGSRTHDALTGIAVFKTAALGHYAIPPRSYGNRNYILTHQSREMNNIRLRLITIQIFVHSSIIY